MGVSHTVRDILMKLMCFAMIADVSIIYDTVPIDRLELQVIVLKDSRAFCF